MSASGQSYDSSCFAIELIKRHRVVPPTCQLLVGFGRIPRPVLRTNGGRASPQSPRGHATDYKHRLQSRWLYLSPTRLYTSRMSRPALLPSRTANVCWHSCPFPLTRHHSHTSCVGLPTTLSSSVILHMPIHLWTTVEPLEHVWPLSQAGIYLATP